jgi:hypothetical protein
MNNNFKNFLKEKKDLLIFMGVLIITFISVISIATLAVKPDDEEAGGGGGNIITPPDGTGNNGDDETPVEPDPNPTFQLPIKESYVLSREFFDLDSDASVLVNAVMNNGTTYVESRGISFQREDNKIFDVYSVFPGEVISVSGNSESLEGYTISIKHDNDLTSVYSSLSSVNVAVGDIVDNDSKIGVGGTNINDTDAGIHVHLQLLHNGKYLNPKNAIGKETSELASVVK